jgi:CheY-like chemotaxis protein
LPDIHGSEVLRLLLDNKETNEIPVVVVSADATQKQIQRLIALGAKDYQIKPIDILSFLKIIDTFIK